MSKKLVSLKFTVRETFTAKIANIILSRLMTKHTWTQLRVPTKQFSNSMTKVASTNILALEFEYDCACTRKGALLKTAFGHWIKSNTKVWTRILMTVILHVILFFVPSMYSCCLFLLLWFVLCILCIFFLLLCFVSIVYFTVCCHLAY